MGSRWWERDGDRCVASTASSALRSAPQCGVIWAQIAFASLDTSPCDADTTSSPLADDLLAEPRLKPRRQKEETQTDSPPVGNGAMFEDSDVAQDNPADDNVPVHHGEVAALLPVSPITGRPYTGTSIRRWLDEGVLRACYPHGPRGVYAVRADVDRLAEHLRVRDQGLPRPARDHDDDVVPASEREVEVG